MTLATIATTTATAARDIRGLVWSYIRLTKPRIVTLLVITTIPAMMLADGGMPSVWLMLATVLGGSVVAGGANALNMYFDRDIDRIMLRTRVRPVPSGQVDPEKAAIFGIVLGGAGFAFMQLFVNPLAAFLTAGALVFYVGVYTLILKRSTPLNIVIGGAAGAMPPVIGWAAVTGSVSVEALLMFAIVTLWTPPHFWALSIKYRDDYERARVPMLPVVATLAETKAQIFWYAVALVPVSLLLSATGSVSWIYFAAAVVLGGGFVRQTWRLRSDDGPGAAMGVFRWSIYYLALLFVAVAADRLLLG